MGRVNWSRVLLGGVVAGIIVFVSEGVLNVIVLGQDWEAVMASMGRGDEENGAAMAVWAVWSLLLGITAVWLYAAIRPRYGAGPGTAFRAGFAVWVLAFLLWGIASHNLGLFPPRITLISTVWGLVEVLIATLVGAWLYREEGPDVVVPGEGRRSGALG